MFNVLLDFIQDVHYLLLLYFINSHYCITLSAYCIIPWQLKVYIVSKIILQLGVWNIMNRIRYKCSNSLNCCLLVTRTAFLMLCYKLMWNEVPITIKSSLDAKSDLFLSCLWRTQKIYYIIDVFLLTWGEYSEKPLKTMQTPKERLIHECMILHHIFCILLAWCLR